MHYIPLVATGLVSFLYIATMLYDLGYNSGRKDEKTFQEWKEEYKNSNETSHNN